VTHSDTPQDHFRPFACKYWFQNGWWCITVMARDEEEAKARLEAMGGPHSRVLGLHIHSLPGWLPVWLVAAWAWILNLVNRP
jgi:hypothetical protein